VSTYSVDVYNTRKEKVAQVELDGRVFGAEVKPHLLHDVVRMQLAARRSGTASVKNRAMVSGSGKKPWRQKGTGRARIGSLRSPLWRGGGVIFGPFPRDYSLHLNKKVKKAALRSALSSKVREDKLLVIDSFDLAETKTRALAAMLRRLEIDNAFIIDEANRRLELSARNLPFIKVLKPEGLNVHDILKYDKLVITRACLEKITRSLSA
jgi:large subunit ribosomal protein L4